MTDLSEHVHQQEFTISAQTAEELQTKLQIVDHLSHRDAELLYFGDSPDQTLISRIADIQPAVRLFLTWYTRERRSATLLLMAVYKGISILEKTGLEYNDQAPDISSPSSEAN